MRTLFGAHPVSPLIARFRPLNGAVLTPVDANRGSAGNYLIQMALSKKTCPNLGAESMIRPVFRLLQGSAKMRVTPASQPR